MLTTKGAVNKTVLVYVTDASDGLGLTGLVHNTSGLTASYARPGAARTAISLVTQTVTGSHTDGGFVEVDATNMPGVYRIDVPDAAFASGVDEVYIYLHGATNMVPVAQRVQLSAVDIQNSVRAGLTALPNAAADAAGGLPISDAGGLDIDTLLARLDAAISTRLASASYTAPLDAAGTRTAVGLASANLDTQLSTIDTEVGQIKAKTDSLAFTGSDVRATLDGETVTVGALSSNVITTASIADSAFTAAKFSGVFPANFSSVTVTSGRMAANLTLIGGTDIIAGTSDIIGTLATSAALADVDSEAAWISNAIAVTLDPNIVAIKAVTDKLDDTLENDAGTFRFTTNALEQAPSGGGGGVTLAQVTRALALGRQVFYASPSGTGDGSTHEAPDSLADAVTAANSATGVIALLAGTYTLSSYPLTISDGVRIVGPGRGLATITNSSGSTSNVVLSAGSNNVIEGVTITNVAGIGLSSPVGSRFSTDRRVYNTIFRDCALVAPTDCVFLEAPASGLAHRVVFDRCDFITEFDGLTTSSATAGNGGTFTGAGDGVELEVWLYECRFSPSANPTANQKHIFANHGSGATRKQRIYAINTTFERKTTSTDSGGAISADGPGIEIYLMNCSIKSNAENANSLDLVAANGAKIFVGPGTTYDRSRVSVSGGGQIIEIGVNAEDVETIAAAIRDVTDDLATTLEDSATPGVKRFKEPTLEEAPAGEATINQQDIRDALKLAPSAGDPAAGSIDAKLDAVESPAGSGDTAVTLTINDTASTPVANAQVWLRASADEDAPIVASGFTNDAGRVTFFLDSGVTYYRWASAPPRGFTNPQSFEVP
jgi:hypothetical protein